MERTGIAGYKEYGRKGLERVDVGKQEEIKTRRETKLKSPEDDGCSDVAV